MPLWTTWCSGSTSSSKTLKVGRGKHISREELIEVAALSRRTVDMYSPMEEDDLSEEEKRQFRVCLTYLALIEMFHISDSVAIAASVCCDAQIANSSPEKRRSSFNKLVDAVVRWRECRGLWKRG